MPRRLQSKLPFIEYKGTRYYLDSSGHYESHSPKGYLHRVIWEEHHGPIPEGHVVSHKDGNRDNNSPDNLYITTVSEFHSRPHKTCLKCDRPVRGRGLCYSRYHQLYYKERLKNEHREFAARQEEKHKAEQAN